MSIIVGFTALGVTGITTFLRLLFAEDPLTVRSSTLEDSV
jgi:hypothetical protein